VLINTSRGGLMDTRAVIDGLESGAIGGLGMDVYEKEGPLFFRDFSTMNRAERMKGWDEQMGVRLRLACLCSGWSHVCARACFFCTLTCTDAGVPALDTRRARSCCCRCPTCSSRRTAPS
jgi:hypothetical protein